MTKRREKEIERLRKMVRETERKVFAANADVVAAGVACQDPYARPEWIAFAKDRGLAMLARAQELSQKLWFLRDSLYNAERA